MDKEYPMEPGLYLMDCMEGMKQFPDGFFDIAICDPPYGDGNIGGGTTRFDKCENVEPVRWMVRQVQGSGTDSGRGSTDTRARWNGCPKNSGVGTEARAVERTGGTWAAKYGKKIIAWDVAPGKEYFDELFRVSRNQIIWGGNYFELPPTRCFLVWRKLTISETFSMAMAEYAWTSFNGNAKVFECAPQGTAKEERFHPTQKPVKLYSWQLGLFAKPGMKILDTHAGSASSLIACQRAGLEAWGFEISPAYYEKAKARLDREKAQVTMFELEKDD